MYEVILAEALWRITALAGSSFHVVYLYRYLNVFTIKDPDPLDVSYDRTNSWKIMSSTYNTRSPDLQCSAVFFLPRLINTTVFASFNEVESMESSGFRKLSDLQLEYPYQITVDDKITTRFGEKVHLALETSGRAILLCIINRVATKEILRYLNKRESRHLYNGTQDVRKIHPDYLFNSCSDNCSKFF